MKLILLEVSALTSGNKWLILRITKRNKIYDNSSHF